MTTPSHQLRETILEVLSAEHPQPIGLQELYRAVERTVAFDVDDLIPIPVKRGRGTEPAWKREARIALQELKSAGTIVNIAYNAWRLPSPDPHFTIDATSAWSEVREEARKALERGPTDRPNRPTGIA